MQLPCCGSLQKHRDKKRSSGSCFCGYAVAERTLVACSRMLHSTCNCWTDYALHPKDCILGKEMGPCGARSLVLQLKSHGHPHAYP